MGMPIYSCTCLIFSEKKNLHLNLLTKDKILALTKLKGSADDKLNVTKMMFSVFYRVQNTVGKGENAGYQYFLLLPQYFQNATYSASFEVVSCDCVVKSQSKKG